MAGVAQTTMEVPVTAGTQAILTLPKEIASEGAEILETGPCIRCNLCVDHCPALLSPAMITMAAEQKEFSIAKEWDAGACIECGTCGYVCPSKRPMLQLIRSVGAASEPAVTRG